MQTAKQRVDTLKAELATLITAAKAGNMTEHQVGRLDHIREDIETAQAEAKDEEANSAKAKRIAEGDALLAAFRNAPEPDDPSPLSYLNPQNGVKMNNFSVGRKSFSDLATQFTSQAVKQAGTFGAKAIFSGASYTVGINGNRIVPLSRATDSVIEALGSNLIDGRHYEHLRQTNRANNAAPVAEGALKPTSTMTLERVDGVTGVTAHLSEPVDIHLLSDINTIGQFVESELVDGLYQALDKQVVTGILAAEGIQVQAFNVDILTTVRNAITKARLQGYTPDLLIMSYTDWEALELLRENGGSGRYLLNDGPIDLAERKLWGLQVVETDKLPASTSIVMDSKAATNYITKPGVQIEWSTIADDFARNQVRCRTEIRTDLAIEKPAGIVKVSHA